MFQCLCISLAAVRTRTSPQYTSLLAGYLHVSMVCCDVIDLLLQIVVGLKSSPSMWTVSVIRYVINMSECVRVCVCVCVRACVHAYICSCKDCGSHSQNSVIAFWCNTRRYLLVSSISLARL